MAASLTSVKLCNRALLRLGEPAIESFEGSDLGSTCEEIYADVIGSILAEHPWRFTMAKKRLAQLSTAPANEWRYAYQLPSDMNQGPYTVFSSEETSAHPVADWEIFGDTLMTDHELIVIDYQKAVSESLFPEWFGHLVVLALAAALAPIVTDSSSIAQEYFQRAYGSPGQNRRGGYFGTAVQIDSASNPNDALIANDLIIARQS